MPTKHAFLSASASHRWLNCPPSAKLCESLPDQTSSFAQEGTDCHELCAYLVEKAIGKDVKDPTQNLTYYNAEMQNCAEEYCSYVLEQLEEAKKYCADPMVFIEQRLDFSRWVENGFGTGDCLILADQVLQIIDYKHGLGVLVESDHNSQMMCYALGALEAFDGIYDIHIHRNADVRMPHEVLQGLLIHSRFCHIGAISMAAYMWSDVRPLHSVNVDRLQ